MFLGDIKNYINKLSYVINMLFFKINDTDF